MLYALIICVYVLVGMMFIAYMTGADGDHLIFEPIDIAMIMTWPLILVAVVLYRPIAYLYKLFFKLGRKSAQRKKAKRNN